MIEIWDHSTWLPYHLCVLGDLVRLGSLTQAPTHQLWKFLYIYLTPSYNILSQRSYIGTGKPTLGVQLLNESVMSRDVQAPDPAVPIDLHLVKVFVDQQPPGLCKFSELYYDKLI